MDNAFYYVIKNKGIDTESSYAYKGAVSRINLYKIKNFYYTGIHFI